MMISQELMFSNLESQMYEVDPVLISQVSMASSYNCCQAQHLHLREFFGHGGVERWGCLDGLECFASNSS